MRVPAFLLLGAGFLLHACGGGDGDPPSVAQQILAAEDAVYHRLCECHAAVGQPDPDTCFTFFVARTDPQEDCVRELFDAHADGLDDILPCQLDVIDVAMSCLDAVVACDPPVVLECASTGLADAAACGEYPEPVRAGIDACYR
jgi:hypothetical protein